MSRVSILKIILCCLLIIINGCTSASSSECLAESDHPYANNFVDTWPDISESGANQIRVHFENIDLASYDKLILYDKYDNKLVTYNYGNTGKDFWTEWYTGDTLKVKLVTDNSYTAYGFKIDKIEFRSDVSTSNNSLPESYHPYANNFEYTWPDISKPGATQIRLHFENLDLASYDKLILYDKYDDKLVSYNYGNTGKDFWTEWYTGDTLKVKLVTDNSKTGYGLKIDEVEGRSDMGISDNSLAESHHPYANNFEYTWPDISRSGAAQIRLHFENLDLTSYDKLILYDKYDNKLVTYNYGNTGKDFWTEWYTGDTLKVKLVTDNSITDYGFKIDKGEIKDEKNVTTTFTESTKTLDSDPRGVKGIYPELPEKTPESSQNFTVYLDSIYKQIIEIGVLNISETEDQSWISNNIGWIFSGVGVSLIGFMYRHLKKSKDEKLEDN
ncbi:hypothetical protein [Methanosarcina sp. 1.H.A.2.2]|uniref:hypothetical protein n=1 Tax=Methanosarcina sp. 1.H.A.2.2 TaxID=1483601 RepID=UPI0006213EBA|nr:hypothetical protein [Methanosarcina sp. 1.H.A.2.2]KKH45797.1 hypothetical protein EO93_05035 [Methanosarcina sp. 1.H.A.2.2]